MESHLRSEKIVSHVNQHHKSVFFFLLHSLSLWRDKREGKYEKNKHFQVEVSNNVKIFAFSLIHIPYGVMLDGDNKNTRKFLFVVRR